MGTKEWQLSTEKDQDPQIEQSCIVLEHHLLVTRDQDTLME